MYVLLVRTSLVWNYMFHIQILPRIFPSGVGESVAYLPPPNCTARTPRLLTVSPDSECHGNLHTQCRKRLLRLLHGWGVECFVRQYLGVIACPNCTTKIAKSQRIAPVSQCTSNEVTLMDAANARPHFKLGQTVAHRIVCT